MSGSTTQAAGTAGTYPGAPDGYAAALDGVALFDRSDRRVLVLSGRDPVRMIQGLITNDLAGAGDGRGVYAAMLTAKGKMVGAMRAFRMGDDVLLDVDAGAFDAVREHIGRFVPPLFAKARAPEPGYEVLGVYGPDAGELLQRVLGALPAEAEDSFVVDDEGRLVVRTAYAGVPGYDIFVPGTADDAAAAGSGQPDATESAGPGHSAVAALRKSLFAGGAVPGTDHALETLRIEAGRPRWGAELGPDRIPLEAGLLERAISTSKGCYTGQEVIVRILHRGHVNWNLRGLELGDSPPPDAEAELTRLDADKVVARVTSALRSPRLGHTIALAYVRREVQSGDELRLAAGGAARVVELPFVAPVGAGGREGAGDPDRNGDAPETTTPTGGRA